MKRSQRILGLSWLFGAIVLMALPLQADVKIDTRAAVPQSFSMYIVHDQRFDKKDDRNREGKFHCCVCEHGLFPVIASFSRTIPKDENAAIVSVIQKQEELATKYKAQRLGAFTAFLSLVREFPDDESRDQLIPEVKNAARSAKAKEVTIGLAQTTMNGVAFDPLAKKDPMVKENLPPAMQNTAWEIAAEDDITIIVYHRYRIVQRWKFTKDTPPTAEDLDKVAAVVDQLMKRK